MSPRTTKPTALRLFATLLLLLAAGEGCRLDMHDAPKYEPLEQSDFFADRQASRPLVQGTVARGYLRQDKLLYTGKIDGDFAPLFPFPITEEILLRGQERYNIYCSPCHGRTGNGRGMIVQRGLKQPESYHSQRLLEMPPGYYYDVITNGFGVMYSYASRIKPEERWAIAAYIRALQYSQAAPLEDLPQEDRQRLRELQ
ncbi:MAG TPA: cytochrome c [Acidobacteriota bacterium]|nr:cytochrome c [Acidobacteriota bacterium]